MRRKIGYMMLGLLAGIFLTACVKEKEPEAKEEFVYFSNADSTNLVKQPCAWSSGDPEEEIEKILKAMKNPEESVEYKSALPPEVEVVDFTLKDGKLDIFFNDVYLKMTKPEEVICRAAVVQSLTQVKDVSLVKIFVEDQPLTKADGIEVGYMREDDFLQNTGIALHSYKETTLKLYFANANGDKLVSETVNTRYNSNMSIEKVIVEKLLKGPKGEEMKATIPPETKLLGISVRDGICYVNFDEGFLGQNYGVDPTVALSSLVNSIVEGGVSTQVQISVNGETNVKFQGVADLSKPFEKNLEVMEEKK